MFTKSFVRATRSTTAPWPSSWNTAGRPASVALSATASRSSLPSKHQLRRSSSKASCPPGGHRGSDQAASNTLATSEAKPATDEEGPSAASPAPPAPKPHVSRMQRRKSKDAAAESIQKAREEPFANPPAVPSTQHLHFSDVALSSLFALHRPISVTTAFPPQSANVDKFNSIFEPRPQHRIQDTIYTLNHSISALEGRSGTAQQSQEERSLHWEIIQQSSSNAEAGGGATHLDGAPGGMSLEQLVKQFRPFHKPPVPVPFDEAKVAAAVREAESRRQREEEAQSGGAAAVVSKTFTTTLTIKESTSPSGQKTYEASASPFVEQSASPSSSATSSFARRARARRGGMLLISTKRRRLLKMKKHKYKKLMKRTRTLRRKEGRI